MVNAKQVREHIEEELKDHDGEFLLKAFEAIIVRLKMSFLENLRKAVMSEEYVPLVTAACEYLCQWAETKSTSGEVRELAKESFEALREEVLLNWKSMQGARRSGSYEETKKDFAEPLRRLHEVATRCGRPLH